MHSHKKDLLRYADLTGMPSCLETFDDIIC